MSVYGMIFHKIRKSYATVYYQDIEGPVKFGFEGQFRDFFLSTL